MIVNGDPVVEASPKLGHFCVAVAMLLQALQQQNYH